MNKKIAATLAILTVAAAGAFAQIGVGINAAIYSDTGMRFSEFGDRLGEGEGVFYGPFIELAMDKLALGFSANFSFYKEDWSYSYPGEWLVPMVDYDLTLYAQGHFLGYSSLLDPFLEMGFGLMAKDYARDSDDPDPDNPIMGTTYWQIGGGLGVNFGPIGIFIKGLYLFPFGTVKGEYYEYDMYGNEYGPIPYDISEYPLKRLKLILGGKIIL